MGMDIYAKQIAPRDTWGVLGGHQFKSIGKLSDWHQLWSTSADSSGNGHRYINTIRPSFPQVTLGGGGGVRVSPIKKSRLAVKRLDRLMTSHLAQICRSIWEWIYANQIAPRDTRGGGHLGGFSGQTLKSLGKLSNGWTDWHQLWFTSADSSGNGHRLNPSRPSIPQGTFGGGGGVGRHKFKKVLGSCQTAAPIGTKFGTRRRIRLGMDIG